MDTTFGLLLLLLEFSLGPAHVDPHLKAESDAALREVSDAERMPALDRIVPAAHRLAESTVKLEPDTLEQARQVRLKPRRGRYDRSREKECDYRL